uniref:Uncharacterized protein n=1 Tax=Panagrolaimus davidi TaxID=227884 RepID=A0A914Q610_9BILA
MKGIIYFCGVLMVFVSARPQQDRNLCKKNPELPYCKIENLEFHISRVISAEPEPDPNVYSKKLIEPDQNSSAPNPILSNTERELAIKDSKQPIEVLVEEHQAKKIRDKREIDDSDTTEAEYLTYRRQRAKILNELNDLDDEQRYRSSSSSDSSSLSRYYPSDSSSSFASRYPSYGHSLYGNPSYGYGGNTFGIGSGLNVMGVGVSSGLGLNIG